MAPAAKAWSCRSMPMRPSRASIWFSGTCQCGGRRVSVVIAFCDSHTAVSATNSSGIVTWSSPLQALTIGDGITPCSLRGVGRRAAGSVPVRSGTAAGRAVAGTTGRGGTAGGTVRGQVLGLVRDRDRDLAA